MLLTYFPLQLTLPFEFTGIHGVDVPSASIFPSPDQFRHIFMSLSLAWHFERLTMLHKRHVTREFLLVVAVPLNDYTLN